MTDPHPWHPDRRDRDWYPEKDFEDDRADGLVPPDAPRFGWYPGKDEDPNSESPDDPYAL